MEGYLENNKRRDHVQEVVSTIIIQLEHTSARFKGLQGKMYSQGKKKHKM